MFPFSARGLYTPIFHRFYLSARENTSQKAASVVDDHDAAWSRCDDNNNDRAFCIPTVSKGE